MWSRLQHKLNAFELYTIDVIYGRSEGAWSAVYAAFLHALSWLFSGVAQARLWLYQRRILHDQPLGCLVVVVGNLTVGGTGKTPVVEKFARALRDRGRRVAILSRGYKSRPVPLWRQAWIRLTHTAEPPPRVVSDGVRVLLDSELAGDEPFMLARNLPGVVVLVDKNRVKAGAYAIRKFGCDTLVLDDGFQYLPLKGRLNLLLVDKTNPFGNGALLPRGILREPVKHLRRASHIFLTKSDGVPDAELDELIRRHNPRADVIECAHRPGYLQRFGEPVMSGVPVVAGVADPGPIRVPNVAGVADPGPIRVPNVAGVADPGPEISRTGLGEAGCLDPVAGVADPGPIQPTAPGSTTPATGGDLSGPGSATPATIAPLATMPAGRVPLTHLRGRRVLAFSGIATPESFEKFLRDLGADLVARERFLDHYRYTAEDLAGLFALAQREGAECLVTTEKDAVRVTVAAGCPLPLYYLRLEIELLHGAADFDAAVERICFSQHDQL
jgi:tetraacyldisaccharide 4'-kinase